MRATRPKQEQRSNRGSTKGNTYLTTIRLRVKEGFTATQVTTRRREAFVRGELIIVIDGSELPSESRFIRLNGLRASKGLECRYTLGTDELKEKTEVAGRPQ
jgi:hypothetical protein